MSYGDVSHWWTCELEKYDHVSEDGSQEAYEEPQVEREQAPGGERGRRLPPQLQQQLLGIMLK